VRTLAELTFRSAGLISSKSIEQCRTSSAYVTGVWRSWPHVDRTGERSSSASLMSGHGRTKERDLCEKDRKEAVFTVPCRKQQPASTSASQLASIRKLTRWACCAGSSYVDSCTAHDTGPARCMSELRNRKSNKLAIRLF
jgi:hypothetical protein